MLIKNKKIKFINLGCRVNLYETSAIVHNLKQKGAKVTETLDDADICVINTCTVTNKADAKSRYFINRACKQKNVSLIVVIGCYSQLNKNINDKVEIVLGVKYKNELVDLIEQYNGHKIIKIDNVTNIDEFENFTNSIMYMNTRAFIKIQDGCNYRCSYCLIPLARGKQRSMDHQKVIDTIRSAVNNDYKEIVLSGVNVAGYKDGEWDFYNLLRCINELNGSFRVRISSIEPFQLNKPIIDLVLSNPQRWCQHFHICIQSASNKVIKDMKRRYSVEDFVQLCKYIRNKNPLVSITTDYIVGFPTETKDCFRESLENLAKIKFCYMHIFPYSAREGTYASKLMNIVSDTEKKTRFTATADLISKLQTQYLKQFIGKTVNVLFEKSNETNIQKGHSEYFFMVKLKTHRNLTNQLMKVKITSLKHNQLFGTLIQRDVFTFFHPLEK